MIWLLCIFLAINLVFVYFLIGKRLFSPTIIVNGVFLMSALVMLTNWEFFGYEDISVNAFLIIVASIYVLLLGELFSYSIKQKKIGVTKNGDIAQAYPSEPMKISGFFLIVVCAIALYVIVGGTVAVYRVSLTLGNTNGILHAFSYARKYVNAGNTIEISRFITYPAVFVKASALYCMFLFSYNRVNVGKSSFKLLLPGVLYCMYTITSTSRTGVLEILCAFIIMFYAIYTRKNMGVKNSNSKLIRITIIIGVLAALLFMWMGNLRTVAYEENTASDIVNYLGSPLIVFSRWLEKYQLSPYPGYATFPQMINILSKLGIVSITISHDEMYSAEDVLASSKSNLKTWLRAPIQDYTIAGMLISRFLIGVLYALLVRWLTKKEVDVTKHPGKFIFACLLFYPLISAAFADKFGVYIQLETLYMAIIYVFIGMAAKKWNTKTGKKYIS